MRRVLLLFAVALVAGCDSGSDEVAFRGVTVETRGDASLTVDGDALVVTGIGPGRSGGFTIPGNASRVDVEIDPLAIPAGARFGIEVEDASGNDIASFYNVGNDLGGVDFVFDFPASTGLEAVRLTYRIGGEGGRAVFSDVLELVLPRQTVARLPPTSGGSGSGSTTSTHVIREGGRYIVVSDSDPPQNTRLGCAGFVATPPPTLDSPDPQAVCTDWIEVEPLTDLTVPQGEVSVTGASVGSFTVRELTRQ